MSFIGNALSSLFVGPLLGAIIGKRKPAPAPAAPMTATRDDAAAAVAADDELRRRKGSASDILTGSAGAEAAAGSIGKLIAGN